MGMNKAEAIRILKTTSDPDTIQVALNFPNNEVLLALFENKNLTPQQKQYIVDTADFSNYELTKEISKVLCYSKNSKTRFMIARYSKSIDALIYLYLNDPLDEIKSEARRSLFYFENISNAQFRTIISDNNYDHDLFAVKHDDCPSDILIELYNKYSEPPESKILDIIANRKDCPKEIMEKILTITNDDHTIIEKLSKDSCPVNLLYLCMNHRHGNVRATIASNINCPLDILDKYATDKSKQVKRAVIKNKNVTVDIIDKVFSDIEDINSFFEPMIFDMTHNSKYPNRKELSYLLLSKYSNKLNDDMVDTLLNFSGGYPKSILLKYTKHENDKIRSSVIYNKNFDEDVCRCYLNESNEKVCRHAIEEAICEHFSDDLIYELIIRYLEICKNGPNFYYKSTIDYIFNNSYLMSKLTQEQKKAIKGED